MNSLLKRLYSSAPINYYQLFPKTFKSSPSSTPFKIDLAKLRKEYRLLQASNHPDKQIHNQLNSNGEGNEAIDSSLLNKAYTTLKSPLLRSQYLLTLKGIDPQSETLKDDDNSILLEILEIHEILESSQDLKEIEPIKLENDDKITKLQEELNDDFNNEDYSNAFKKTLRLKYLYNIDQAIKNWQPGKPINLTH